MKVIPVCIFDTVLQNLILSLGVIILLMNRLLCVL